MATAIFSTNTTTHDTNPPALKLQKKPKSQVILQLLKFLLVISKIAGQIAEMGLCLFSSHCKYLKPRTQINFYCHLLTFSVISHP